MDVSCTTAIKCPRTLNFLNRRNFAKRGGFIPYHVDSDGISYLLGIKNSKRGRVYADFGGGCKKEEPVLSCAIREFTEESRALIDIRLDDITHVYLVGKKRPYRIMFFVKLPNKDETLPDKFLRKRPKSKEEEEISGMSWLFGSEIESLNTKHLSISIREVLEHGLLEEYL